MLKVLAGFVLGAVAAMILAVALNFGAATGSSIILGAILGACAGLPWKKKSSGSERE